MSVELEARVRRASLVSQDLHLERLYGDDLSHRLLRDIYSKKEGRMSELTDRPEQATVQEGPADEKALRPAPAQPRRERSRAFAPAILTAMIAIGVIVVIVALVNRQPSPVAAQTPVEIAEAFMAALNEHDAEAVRALLASDAAMQGEVVEFKEGGPVALERQLEQEEVLGWTYHVESCADLTREGESAESVVHCYYAFSNDISRALGDEPYATSRYDLVIVDGKIASTDNSEYDTAFHDGAMRAFGQWLVANHPEAGDMYYEYLDEENLAKWKQYLPEFVAAMEEAG